MADLESKLGAVLSPGPVPSTGRAFVDYVGGRDAAARAISGMDGPPKAAAYDSPEQLADARRTWNNARRQAQRYSAGEGRQQRGRAAVTIGDEQRARARREARVRRRRDIERRGVTVRIKATTRISSAGGAADVRTRVMPAGGPGIALDESTTADLLDLMGDGREGRDDAAELLRETFLEEYGLPEYTEFDSVQWLKVWPTGETEPAL